VIDRLSAAHAHNIRVFGSVARGEDEPGSDVDLLYDGDETTSIYALAAAHLDLQELITCGMKQQSRRQALIFARLVDSRHERCRTKHEGGTHTRSGSSTRYRTLSLAQREGRYISSKPYCGRGATDL